LTALADSHAHLDFEQFADDLDQVLARAAEAGVAPVITVGTDLASSRRALELAGGSPMLHATAGIHPHEAGNATAEDWAALRQLFSDEQVVGVGETGLDYHYRFHPPEVQQDLFRRHLRLSGEVGRPVVIHVREAFDDAFAILGEEGVAAGGVLHCFTGGPRECERALELGLHISLAGIVTFPQAAELQQAARLVPADRLLVETDAPYLAPVPLRGKRNEPAYVVHTARKVAALRQVGFDELCAETRANTIRLFGLGDRA
jgi:TatD DNase family protein